MRLIATFVLSFFVAQSSHADDWAIARADAGEVRSPYVYYLTLEHVPPEVIDDWRAALPYVVTSFSRQVIVEKSVPVAVDGSDTLYRIDLQDMLWEWRDWFDVLKDYPYRQWSKAPPLVVRGDWLMIQLVDENQADAGHRLLFGGKSIPANKADFYRQFRVDEKNKEQEFGWWERDSSVANSGERWIESLPTSGGRMWSTRDVIRFDFEKDFGRLVDFKHDAEEHIAQLQKVSIATGVRGFVHAYLLAEGDGSRVAGADPQAVTGPLMRGSTQVVNSMSCMVCHGDGLNPAGKNGLRRLIESGVQTYSYDKRQQYEIEFFHLTDSQTEIDRHNASYSAIMQQVSGLAGSEWVAAYRSSIAWYDEGLTIDQAARELHCTAEQLKSAISLYHRGDYGPYLPALAESGDPISREVWEAGQYLFAETYLKQWREEVKK